MNRKEAYNVLLKNASNTISYKKDGREVKRSNVSVESSNPQYEYDSLTSAFLFYTRDNGVSFEKVAWKDVTKINGVVFTDGKR